jgi:hypothetical protein
LALSCCLFSIRPYAHLGPSMLVLTTKLFPLLE